ncbi:hypothetical protein [Dyadobacter arcticus]|uniref:Uncharacterized protein n=1 Tax=Dyadobacter arcticus TaxID=1078754 RepID=A0ABX0ULK7_9BACT|nr:hypothetical protein [Dyadobacter arcticus]NIJ52340.1 hypothetical protein [Dyadobacter arcticus]
MATRNYTRGNSANEISIAATIGTPGIAHTSVALHRGTGQKLIIAESGIDSGNIPKTAFGTAPDLENCKIIVVTAIDFSDIDPANWESARQNLFTRYGMSGGLSGAQVYNHDTDDVTVFLDGQLIIVTKVIILL